VPLSKVVVPPLVPPPSNLGCPARCLDVVGGKAEPGSG
jgi:hypothetical protein